MRSSDWSSSDHLSSDIGGNVNAPFLHGNEFHGTVNIYTGADFKLEDRSETLTGKIAAVSCTTSQTEVSVTAPTEASEEHRDLKEIIKGTFRDRFADLYEGTSLEGDHVHLEDIYTELYVIKGCTGGVNTKHEVRQIESFYPKVEGKPIKFTDIFKTPSDQIKLGTKVLTLGIAGVGKTASVHKFILDWATEKCNQELDFILFLPFRELNLIKDEHYSLCELLHYFHNELRDEDVLEILNNKRPVAFILDGLDESKIPLNFDQKKVCDVTENATPDKLITNLIKGDLLPSALIWVTSRPAAVNQIPRKYFKCVTEIRGFSDPQKEEFFRRRIKDQDQAHRIISNIKTARSLHILCHIPVFCSISASVLQEMLKNSKDLTDAPRTLTEMYTRFLLFHTRRKSEKYSSKHNKDRGTLEVESVLKLGKLAFLQLQKGQLIFYERDLKECGIDFEEAVVYSGVCTQIFKKDEKIFSFVHLSFQEFLAAVFVFLTFCHGYNPLLQTPLERMTWKFKHTLDDLLKTAVKKAMTSENGHLDLFLRFLFGLSLESNQRLLKSLQPEIEIRVERLKDSVNYVKRKIQKNISIEKTMNLFHCLSEIKDSSLTSDIQKYMNSGDLSTQQLSSTQWSALIFVLLMSEETQEKFELKKYGLAEGLMRLLPVVKNTRRALLDHCNLSGDMCEALSSVLSSDAPLKELDLSNNYVQDSGVELLSSGLKSSHCNLKTLRLSGCTLGIKACEHVGLILKLENCSLKELDLSNNNLQDSGVEVLSSALRSSHCKLEILRLAGCNLGDDTCRNMGSVLKLETSSLKELDLSKNRLHDSGVKLLSAGLKSSHCKLQTLRLALCDLGIKTCLYLESALQSKTLSLKELDLSKNDLQDSGVKVLSNGLKSSHCKLEILRLAICNFTVKSFRSLITALQTNLSTMKELDLSNNDLQDSGIELLSAALKSSQCELETLRITGCNLGVKTCENVGSILKLENSSLKELDLSNNDLQDSGVELLSAGLKSSHCKLETLGLSGCMITEKGCSSLNSALSSNSTHLKELDLTYNHPGESGEKLLSVRLEDPHCSLNTLRMEYGGNFRIKSGPKKYACEITLDPNTAHTSLCLCEGNRKVVCVEEKQSYPDHPDRFDYYGQVLCRESISGRCYWEAEWSGAVSVALTYKTIRRKGNSEHCWFGRNAKSWSLNCSNTTYSAYSKYHIHHFTSLSSSNRVGVYVDCPAGTLSFYSISSDTHTLTHLHTFNTTFTEPLYAGFEVRTLPPVLKCLGFDYGSSVCV